MTLAKRINKWTVGWSAARGWERVWGRPVSLQVEPTDRCNLKCIMCPRTFEDVTGGRSHDLTLTQFEHVLDEIRFLVSMQLSGFGEPFLNRELPEMIALAVSRGVQVSTNSNATVFTEDIVKRTVASGLYMIKLSVDGATDETYARIRGGKLDSIRRGLTLFAKEKARTGSTLPWLRFNIVLLKDNVEELDLFFDLAHELAVPEIMFKPLNPHDTSMGIGRHDALGAQVKETFEKACEKGHRYDILWNEEETRRVLFEAIDIAKRRGDLPAIPCYMLWKECYITADGSVRPCCEFYRDEHKLGNIFETPFSKIWNSEGFRRLRRASSRLRSVSQICTTCNRFYVNYLTHDKLRRAKEKMGPLGALVRTEFED